jgi:hypothetical protein
MILLSCSNCWFNGLQHGSVGLSVGYCVEHRVVLRQADSTTCPRLMRKDLAIDQAETENKSHKRRFPADKVQLVRPNGLVPADSIATPDTAMLRQDRIGEVAADYGELGSKIESLARLKEMRGGRPELAMLSLGRGYVRRCVQRGGRWTSGLHLLWWTKARLARVPELRIGDFRLQTAVSLDRQAQLAQWSLMMLRLNFISDLARHAKDDQLETLSSLVEDAARATEIPSVRRLVTWIRSTGAKKLHRALSDKRYSELSKKLHKDDRA